jgi:hypothetical protein
MACRPSSQSGAPGVENTPGATVAIPAPREIDAHMRAVPIGALTTVSDIRDAVAREHNADFGCPMTTGIFAWIAAHAAEEAAQAGEPDITPYWRTLKAGGELNPKYPGGIEQQKARLQSEGHQIVEKGRKTVVAGYEHSLVELT